MQKMILKIDFCHFYPPHYWDIEQKQVDRFSKTSKSFYCPKNFSIRFLSRKLDKRLGSRVKNNNVIVALA